VKSRFVLVSRWALAASRERVWELLTQPEQWPRWWPRLESARRTVAGAPDGTGAVTEFCWNSGLGYRVEFEVATVRVLPACEIEGAVRGSVKGSGLWLVEPEGPGVRLTYRWDVELQRPWMRFFAPLLWPVFASRHFRVMRDGARAMAGQLGCPSGRVEEWSSLTLRPS
jgi:carbon monoxide dehydrogenase subunit G